MQQERDHVHWGEKQVNNCWRFIYLGSCFQADGSQMADIERRIAMARTRFGKLRHIWAAPQLPTQLKLRLYRSAICSILTYGSEAWTLDETTTKSLRGANAQMLVHVTGRTHQEEASSSSTTFDVVTWVRALRLKWAGHILRMPKERLVHQAAKHLYDNPQHGCLLMDVPKTESWEKLLAVAKDRDGWRTLVRQMKARVQADPKLGKKAQDHLQKAREEPARSPLKEKPLRRSARQAAMRKAKRAATPPPTLRRSRPLSAKPPIHPFFHSPSRKRKRKKKKKTDNNEARALFYHNLLRPDAQPFTPTPTKKIRPEAQPSTPTPDAMTSTPTPTLTPTTSSLWDAPALIPTDCSINTSTDSSLWAAPAPIPTDSSMNMTIDFDTTTFMVPNFHYSINDHTSPPFSSTLSPIRYPPPPLLLQKQTSSINNKQTESKL